VRGKAPHRYFLVLYAYFFGGKGVASKQASNHKKNAIATQK
jgi:hypothetical protein